MRRPRYRPIGVIRSPYRDTGDIPRGVRGSRGTVEFRPEFSEGLADLKGFSHIILVFHLHKSEGALLRLRPRGEKKSRGIFATRSPRRPNPIGITVVKLEGVRGTRLRVWGLDVIDGTPLLDIKPYLPDKDTATGVCTGWYGERRKRERQDRRRRNAHA